MGKKLVTSPHRHNPTPPYTPPKKTSVFVAPSAGIPSADQLLSNLPGLQPIHREAFLSQFADVDCTALGAKTKSSAVRACAISWAAEAAPVLLNPNLASEIDYTAERLTWLVELIANLDAACAELSRKDDTHATVRTQRDIARVKAKDLRARLLSKLSRTVPGDELASAKLAGASSAPTDQDLIASLNGLASIVEAVTKSKDPKQALLAASARVSGADADAARAAAQGLSAATDDVALGGRAKGNRDTPEVNVIEGRVLFELLFVRDALEEARRRGAPVPALIAPTGLRHVLAHSHAKGALAEGSAEPSIK